MGSTIRKNFLTDRPGPKWNGAAISQRSTDVQMGVSGPLPEVLWERVWI